MFLANVLNIGTKRSGSNIAGYDSSWVPTIGGVSARFAIDFTTDKAYINGAGLTNSFSPLAFVGGTPARDATGMTTSAAIDIKVMDQFTKGLLDAGVGTIYAETDAATVTLGDRIIGTNAGNAMTPLFANSATQAAMLNGSAGPTATAGSSTYAAICKTASAWDDPNTTVTICLNNGTVGVNAALLHALGIYTNITLLIGSNGGGVNRWNGKVRKVALWDFKASNAQLGTLTT